MYMCMQMQMQMQMQVQVQVQVQMQMQHSPRSFARACSGAYAPTRPSARKNWRTAQKARMSNGSGVGVTPCLIRKVGVGAIPVIMMCFAPRQEYVDAADGRRRDFIWQRGRGRPRRRDWRIVLAGHIGTAGARRRHATAAAASAATAGRLRALRACWLRHGRDEWP